MDWKKVGICCLVAAVVLLVLFARVRIRADVIIRIREKLGLFTLTLFGLQANGMIRIEKTSLCLQIGRFRFKKGVLKSEQNETKLFDRLYRLGRVHLLAMRLLSGTDDLASSIKGCSAFECGCAMLFPILRTKYEGVRLSASHKIHVGNESAKILMSGIFSLRIAEIIYIAFAEGLSKKGEEK